MVHLWVHPNVTGYFFDFSNSTLTDNSNGSEKFLSHFAALLSSNLKYSSCFLGDLTDLFSSSMVRVRVFRNKHPCLLAWLELQSEYANGRLYRWLQNQSPCCPKCNDSPDILSLFPEPRIYYPINSLGVQIANGHNVGKSACTVCNPCPSPPYPDSCKLEAFIWRFLISRCNKWKSGGSKNSSSSSFGRVT